MKALKGGESAVEQLEEKLGQQIRGLRKSRGLTQQQLADQANISVGAVKNLEAGRGATIRTLTRVLRVLEAEDWITTLHTPQPTFNPLHLPSLKSPITRQQAAKKGRTGQRERSDRTGQHERSDRTD